MILDPWINLILNGELSQAPGKKMWDDLILARSPSVNATAEILLSNGRNREQLQQVWKLNFPSETRP